MSISRENMALVEREIGRLVIDDSLPKDGMVHIAERGFDRLLNAARQDGRDELRGAVEALREQAALADMPPPIEPLTDAEVASLGEGLLWSYTHTGEVIGAESFIASDRPWFRTELLALRALHYAKARQAAEELADILRRIEEVQARDHGD